MPTYIKWTNSANAEFMRTAEKLCSQNDMEGLKAHLRTHSNNAFLKESLELIEKREKKQSTRERLRQKLEAKKATK